MSALVSNEIFQFISRGKISVFDVWVRLNVLSSRVASPRQPHQLILLPQFVGTTNPNTSLCELWLKTLAK